MSVRTIRSMNLTDVPEVAEGSRIFKGRILPHVHREEDLAYYIDGILVVQEDLDVIGAMHIAVKKDTRSVSFLRDVKQVPDFLVDQWLDSKVNSVYIVQPVGWTKGTTSQILARLKDTVDELKVWGSITNPNSIVPWYEERGFVRGEPIDFYNEMKKGISTFCEITWRKNENSS